MLFHLTMTHSVDECPGYNREKMPELLSALENLEARGKDMNIKTHFVVNAAPEHVVYALVEADDSYALARYLVEVPLKQDFKVTPVAHMHDVLATARAMMAQG